MRKIFSLDRLEGDMAVCISDDDDTVIIPAEKISFLALHDVFSAEISGDTLESITPMPYERERREAESRSRLHAIAKRSKNKS